MFKKAPAKRRSGSPDPSGQKKTKTGEMAAAGEVRIMVFPVIKLNRLNNLYQKRLNKKIN
jgi:hypothetical protein